VQDAAPVVQQQLACLGGHGAAAIAHQQVLAQFDLQQPHLPAQGRLRHVELDRGPGKTAELCDADEVFELLEVHREE
jgi:hypothetical protein